mmetsp:Transcript_18303/g.29188  ORF Transcript_18303/g.29188 Transcript_18303/m.29188 type:complete len:168 (-) Transcript_18303:154-657(-)|eukprot:jgi/Bigna1/83468/fgenesh1_pg.109_\
MCTMHNDLNTGLSIEKEMDKYAPLITAKVGDGSFEKRRVHIGGANDPRLATIWVWPQNTNPEDAVLSNVKIYANFDAEYVQITKPFIGRTRFTFNNVTPELIDYHGLPKGESPSGEHSLTMKNSKPRTKAKEYRSTTIVVKVDSAHLQEFQECYDYIQRTTAALKSN